MDLYGCSIYLHLSRTCGVAISCVIMYISVCLYTIITVYMRFDSFLIVGHVLHVRFL